MAKNIANGDPRGDCPKWGPANGDFFPAGTGTGRNIPPLAMWGRGRGSCPPPRGDPVPEKIMYLPFD